MEKTEISKNLLQQILVFFWEDFEKKTGSEIEDYDNDTELCKLFDGLLDEFSYERIEELFPDSYLKSDRAMAELDQQRRLSQRED